MKQITMNPVVSSQISHVGFDPATNTLRIQFANRKDGSPGSIYDYENVTPEPHQQFIGADSVGSFFHRHIKPHADKFPYKKLGG